MEFKWKSLLYTWINADKIPENWSKPNNQKISFVKSVFIGHIKKVWGVFPLIKIWVKWIPQN